VIAEPGLTPRLPPLSVVGPVLVTVEPPRTRKLCAVPRTVGAIAAFTTNCGRARPPSMKSVRAASSARNAGRRTIKRE